MADAELRSREQQDAALDRLLADVAVGNRASFEALYRATSARLFGICVRVLADRAEAEDVLQDSFVTVWNRAAQFDPGRASALAWLSTIARNKAIDRLRARASAPRAPFELVERIVDPGVSPDRAAESDAERNRLQHCLEQLEERGRGLIRTAFFEGATYEELATRIGAPLGSVKSWIRRGLLQLKVCLGT